MKIYKITRLAASFIHLVVAFLFFSQRKFFIIDIIFAHLLHKKVIS